MTAPASGSGYRQDTPTEKSFAHQATLLTPTSDNRDRTAGFTPRVINLQW
ncbi:hypothetical protein [Actinoplanes subglobosus]|uniref:Uncharacterized protein n=1 Tax=Actinoplanes subglobosus TaxID=1547892 RepID=A0ABV8J4T8_9ACTN